MNNPFRDVSEDGEKLVVWDFSQDVVNSAEAINKVLNPIVNNENEEGLVEMIIAKNRNGPLGSVKLRFDSETVSFRSLDTKHVLDT